jgi:PAS domain S-box-containing protein
MDPESMIQQTLQTNRVTILEYLPEGDNRELRLLAAEGYRSLAYIPLSAEGSKAIGLVRLGSRTSGHFSPERQGVLELIGNRMGAAVENTLLQEQVLKSEEKYRSLFNNDPNPIFILDTEGYRILDTNERAREQYGFTRQEMTGLAFPALGDPEDEEVVGGIRGLRQVDSVFFSKKRHHGRDGTPFYVNINVSRARYGERDVLIATTTDITESVAQETQLIQASKMTTLGQMAAGIAHEINQPLNVIQVSADFLTKMLRRGARIGEEDLRSVAEDITDNVQRATTIIQHMRDFARQSEVTRSRVDLNGPLRDVFKVLGYQLKNHDVTLDLELDEDLPDIWADHNRLEQVFLNLVTNALDAIEEKSFAAVGDKEKRRIRIRTFSEDGQAVVTVSDNGVGMSEEVKSKIFEPFFTTKEVGKGTGLGVSISYGIVKDYNGSIDIESEPGAGTTFTLRFPAIAAEPAPLPVEGDVP